MGDPGPEVVDPVSPSRLEAPTSAAEENEDDIHFVSKEPLRPGLEYTHLVSSDDEKPSTSHGDKMSKSKVPSSGKHHSSCSVPLPIGDSSSSSESCASSSQRIVSRLSSVENPLESQKNAQNNSDNKISETETQTITKLSDFAFISTSAPQESLDSSEIKEDLPIESSASQHGQDAILYLQTQVAEMSQVICDLQSKSCFRLHRSRSMRVLQFLGTSPQLRKKIYQ
ncbi:Zinc finger protein 451 [Fukomys damarensis]|uniref:Zinc finger protein 451 n=1 Tax=Fukomys damarensis TaxID=885580 RepID=A0A091DFR6_FUKDA|nr:Zinc finger protein 451 [Fukomys damarensis]